MTFTIDRTHLAPTSESATYTNFEQLNIKIDRLIRSLSALIKNKEAGTSNTDVNTLVTTSIYDLKNSGLFQDEACNIISSYSVEMIEKLIGTLKQNM